jgi:hypothetical protein
MLSVTVMSIMLNVNMLIVVIFRVVMLNVVAPKPEVALPPEIHRWVDR